MESFVFDASSLDELFGFESSERFIQIEFENVVSEPLPRQPHTEESKRLISESKKGTTYSKEHREAISRGKMGHETSEETREKIRRPHTGKKVSEETRKKMSEAHKGKKRVPLSEETKRKIGMKQRGRIVSDSVKKIISEKTKETQTQKHQKTYIFTTPEGKEFTETTTITDFAERHGLNKGVLVRVLGGHRNHHRGWKVRLG